MDRLIKNTTSNFSEFIITSSKFYCIWCGLNSQTMHTFLPQEFDTFRYTIYNCPYADAENRKKKKKILM